MRTTTPPTDARCLDENPAAPVRVGLVGLGTIGQVHRRVLSALPGVELVFTVDPVTPVVATDPAVAAETPEVPHHAVLEEALARHVAALGGPDLVVLATPTDSHLPLARVALEGSAALVLSEKPFTRDREDLADFLARPAATTGRVRVVDHFGFAPEVTWGEQFARTRGWGAPQSVLSSFNDPYGARPPERLASHISPWVDSGSNQLAVLSRFVDDWRVVGLTSDADRKRSSALVEHTGGHATLVSCWSAADSSKQSHLRWSGGQELFLDHTSMTGSALEAGRLVEHLGHDGAVDRKTAHYRGMYTALLRDASEPLLSLGAAVRIATSLADGAGAPSGDVRWTFP